MNRLPSDASIPPEIGRVLADMQRQIDQLRTARSSESTSVGEGGLRFHSGGGVEIDDGGSLRVVDADGVTIAYLGQFADGTFGWNFRYDTDDPLFTRQGTAGAQFWGFWDQDGNLIFTSDGVTGAGLGRPYLNYRLVPSFAAEGVGEGATSLWPSTTSTSPVKLMQGVNPVWHPRVSIGVATATTGGGNVEWRLDIKGTTVATGAGTGSQTVNVPDWGEGIKPGHEVGFDLYANAAGGATRAWIQCDRLYGLQS